MMPSEMEVAATKFIGGFLAVAVTATATVVLLGGLELQRAATYRKDHPVICKAEPAGGMLCATAEDWVGRQLQNGRWERPSSDK